jgi:hypothetical protein
MSMTYRISYIEELVTVFDIEADSEQEAIDNAMHKGIFLADAKNSYADVEVLS